MPCNKNESSTIGLLVQFPLQLKSRKTGQSYVAHYAGNALEGLTREELFRAPKPLYRHAAAFQQEAQGIEDSFVIVDQGDRHRSLPDRQRERHSGATRPGANGEATTVRFDDGASQRQSQPQTS